MASVTIWQVTSLMQARGIEGIRVQLSPVPQAQAAGNTVSLTLKDPKGLLELYTTTPEGAQFFDLGKRYVVTIAPVED